jgi:CO dehydrogenase/acetyl-CoA synthase delta subunit
MTYLVPPGLYAIGEPGPDDPLLVTANYKMSYDIVRRELSGYNVWLLVLETYGINVWCAAGKGSFGTEELIRQILLSQLNRVVNHRQLILPILGAPGVAAHVVRGLTGFSVRYATIRAADLPEFLDNGMKSKQRMQELTFTFRERLVLTPIELVQGVRNSLPLLAILFLVVALASGTFAPQAGLYAILGYLCALLAGTVAAPLLLPWLPARSFAVKGAVTGIVWALLLLLLAGDGWSGFERAACLLLLPAVSAFFALNFTGSTPFTSRSGVKKEMRLSLPVMACSLVAGIVVWLAGKFLA